MVVKITNDEFKKFTLELSRNNGYCPCKIDKNDDTKCPCKVFRVNGVCECGVYEK